MKEFAATSRKIEDGSFKTLLRYSSFLLPKIGSPNSKYALITDPK